ARGALPVSLGGVAAGRRARPRAAPRLARRALRPARWRRRGSRARRGVGGARGGGRGEGGGGGGAPRGRGRAPRARGGRVRGVVRGAVAQVSAGGTTRVRMRAVPPDEAQAPRSTCPGSAPVCVPFSSTTAPL